MWTCALYFKCLLWANNCFIFHFNINGKWRVCVFMCSLIYIMCVCVCVCFLNFLVSIHLFHFILFYFSNVYSSVCFEHTMYGCVYLYFLYSMRMNVCCLAISNDSKIYHLINSFYFSYVQQKNVYGSISKKNLLNFQFQLWIYKIKNEKWRFHFVYLIFVVVVAADAIVWFL